MGVWGQRPQKLNSFWYHKLKKSILLVAERAHEHQKNSFSNPIINAFLSSFLKFVYNPSEELSNESRKTAPASFEIYYLESGMYSDRKIWRSRSTHQAKYRETWLKTKLDLPISIADLFKIQRNKHTFRLLRQIVILLTDKSNVLMKSLAKVWQRFHQKLKDLSTEHNYRYSSLQPKFRDPSRQVRSQEWCFQQSSVHNWGFLNDFSLDVSKIGLRLPKRNSCFSTKMAPLGESRNLPRSQGISRDY